MENFTPYSALLGGAIIGLAASLMLLLNGKVAGISGIAGKIVSWPISSDASRGLFILGLICGGGLLMLFAPHTMEAYSPRSTPTLIVAGLMVGVGTRIGSGCTSGHGVCGISRLSSRSIIATCTFMAAGFGIVAVITQFLGGQL